MNLSALDWLIVALVALLVVAGLWLMIGGTLRQRAAARACAAARCYPYGAVVERARCWCDPALVAPGALRGDAGP